MERMTDTKLQPSKGIHDHGTFKLGKQPAMAGPKALLFAQFVNLQAITMPAASKFWNKRAKFPLGAWGNDQYGDCTIASQIVASMRNERLETLRTDTVPESEGGRVYTDLSNRLYGGGDNGAYEEDALNNWRNPDFTFRDAKGNPLTIDAYTRLDPKSIDQIKAAILLASGAHGIKVCFNLPLGWQQLVGQAGKDLSVPLVNGKPDLTGPWQPGSWGGHSMYADDYDATGVWVEHTWRLPSQRVTWEAIMAYCDEAHSFVDSLDAWRKRIAAGEAPGIIRLDELADAVNQVSDLKVKS